MPFYGQAVIYNIINDTLLCSYTETLGNCPWRGSNNQLKEKAAELQSQNLHVPWGFIWKVSGKIQISEEEKNSTGRLRDSNNKDPLGHSETKSPTKEHTQDGLRPLAQI